jgi:putative peptidoglycan lipid II flippase
MLDPPVGAPDEIAQAGGLARSAGIIALGNIASRILGMIRMTLIAGLFGATGLVSAYQIAATVPSMAYELLVGGLLSSALVPIFSEYATARDRREFASLTGTMLGLATLILTVLVVLIELLAPQLAQILGGGFSPELLATATRLIRIAGIALLFLGLSGVVTAISYSMKRFTLPAFSAAAFNLGIILSALFLADSLGVYCLAVGIVVGSFIQLLVQLPALRGLGISFRLDLAQPGLRRIVFLYLPVLGGLLIAQFQIAVDRNLASRTGEQSIAWMMNATSLIQFPHGLVAVAISLAVLPSLSRFSALGDSDGYRRTLSLGLRMVIVLTLPATVALFILARPAIAVIFEHGKFTSFDTSWTTLALRCYLFGLIFAAIDWPLNYASYARQDTLTPALVGVFSILVYLLAAFSLMPAYGMIGLVLADSFKQISHAVTMLVLTYRRLGGLDDRRMILTVLKSVIASAAMAATMLITMRFLATFEGMGPFLADLVTLGVAGAVGGMVYVFLGIVLGQDEVLVLWNAARRRLNVFAAVRP